MNPFRSAKSVFDDTPIDFWAQVLTFLEWGYVFAHPTKWFCMAAQVDSSKAFGDWDVGDDATADTWYIHLFGGEDMAGCYDHLLSIADHDKVCFFRWKNGEQTGLKFYNKDRFKQLLEKRHG